MMMPITIARAEGAYLYDATGKSYLDLISSWWTNIHGHCHPAIAKAISKQATELDHIIFANFNHQPAMNLAEQLCSLMPATLQHVFFSDNGSTAVEVALKMAYQYWHNLREEEPKPPYIVPKCEFISLEGNYHGDTLGAMSLGKKSGFFKVFSDLMAPVHFLPFPDIIDNKEEQYQKEMLCLNQAIELLQDQKDKIAAIVVEPLVQGASGMRMCRPEFMNSLLSLCKEAGILLIFDEVMTGFGRTGKLFAWQHLSVEPDIICLAKGITGGFLPLAVTIANSKIFNSFLGNNFSKALAHGHSYTANPIACRAASVSLQILQEDKAKIEQLSLWQAEMISLLKQRLEQQNLGSVVKNARQLGTIVAFEVNIPKPKDPYSQEEHSCKPEYQGNISNYLQRSFLERGLVIRPLGNVVYLMPPYCLTKAELLYAYDIIYEVLKAIKH